VSEVLRDLRLIEEEAAKLGLKFRTSRVNAELLGTPIGGIQSTDNIIQGKAARLRLMGERLCLLQTQDALLLLRHSFAIPKVMYILRSSLALPHLNSTLLTAY